MWLSAFVRDCEAGLVKGGATSLFLRLSSPHSSGDRQHNTKQLWQRVRWRHLLAFYGKWSNQRRQILPLFHSSQRMLSCHLVNNVSWNMPFHFNFAVQNTQIWPFTWKELLLSRKQFFPMAMSMDRCKMLLLHLFHCASKITFESVQSKNLFLNVISPLIDIKSCIFPHLNVWKFGTAIKHQVRNVENT